VKANNEIWILDPTAMCLFLSVARSSMHMTGEVTRSHHFKLRRPVQWHTNRLVPALAEQRWQPSPQRLPLAPEFRGSIHTVHDQEKPLNPAVT